MSSRQGKPIEGTGRLRARVRLALVLGLGAVAGYANHAPAAERQGSDPFISDVHDVRKISITLNKSRTFRVARPFATVVVGAPEIADVRSLSDQVIYVLGRRVGTTNISVFDDKAQLIGILDVDVAVDVSNMQQKIAQTTGTGGIRVSSAQGQVVLSGVAVDAVAAERAVTVAKGLAEGSTIVNALQIAPPQQVLLEVRFLEVNRVAGRELGVNWQANINGKQFVNTGLGSAAVNPVGGGPGSGVPIVATAGTLVGTNLAGPFGTVLANVLNKNGTTLDVLVTALEEKGVVRRLAEPNLIALSGEAARFLAGGEFPVP